MSAYITEKVSRSESGRATTGIKVSVARPRNAKMTRMTRTKAMKSVVCTSETECTIVNERSNVPRAEYDRLRAVLHDAAARGPAHANRAGAKAEAERLATEAKTRIEDFVARRTAMAEAKIAQAEAQAAADVRSAAAEAAVAAAEKILNVEAKGKLAGELLAKGIEDVRKKLN